MQEELIKKFYKRFWINLICGLLGIIILIVVSTITLVNYFNNNGKLYLPLIFIAFLIGVITGTILMMRPFIKDFKAVKTKEFDQITGFVIRFRKVELGGEPPTTEYYPIIAEKETGREIELRIEDLTLGETYTFYYLKNTKLAALAEQLND